MHIIGDTYRETSIKSSEREKRDSFSKVSKYDGPPKVSQVSAKWLQQHKINRITV